MMLGSLVAALAPTLPALSSLAYPIPPVPLRKLCKEASVIVVAEVAGIRVGTRPVAELYVDESLKGHPGSVVYVNVWLDGGCPAPARYSSGKRVLAFLIEDDDGNYVTESLSYGSKEIADDRSLAVYRQRIREMIHIQDEPEGDARLERTVEWLVACAEDPVTRWEGAYELFRSGDRMSTYDGAPPEKFAELLTLDQEKRLLEALIASEGIDAGELCLIQHFQGVDDRRFVPFLVERLRFYADEAPRWAGEVMRAIGCTTLSDRHLKLAEEYESTRLDLHGQESAHRRILREFLELFD